MVAQGGVPARISAYDIASGAPTRLNTHTFTGADIAESKTTVEVTGGKSIITAGSGGIQILNTTTGFLIDTIANPTNTSLAADLVVANAVTVDEDMMFISNGEAGVYVRRPQKTSHQTPARH